MNNLPKQERSHSSDLQEKVDALKEENLALRNKIKKRATKPSEDTTDLLLRHLASLNRSTEQMLSATKETHNTGDCNQGN